MVEVGISVVFVVLGEVVVFFGSGRSCCRFLRSRSRSVG